MTAVRRRAAAASADQEIRVLREKWAPTWRIWRARREDDRPGSLMATRRGEGRRLSMTLMEPTAALLDKALTEQCDQPLSHLGQVGQPP